MIRTAQPDDLPQINAIYNQAVEEGLCTAHTNAVSMEYRTKWFENHDPDRFPVLVYHPADDSNRVLGWVSVSPYRAGREALDEVAEISYYVDFHHHGQGIGTALMQKAMDFLRETSFRIVVGILVSGNELSRGLLEKFGFEEYGRIPDGIHFKDTYRDHLYMGRKL